MRFARIERRWVAAMAVLLVALTAGAHAPAARAAEPAGADPTAQEIRQLRERLARAEAALAQERTQRLIYETQLQVAALGGFQVRELVRHAPLTSGTLTEVLDRSFRRQYPGAALRHSIWLYTFFGALPEGFDLEERLRRLLGEQVAGLYDPETRTLYVDERYALGRGMGRMILAHEIAHALQDQQHDLRAMGIEAEGNDDLAMTVSALAEGEAMVLMTEHLTQTGGLLGLLLDLPRLLTMNQQELNEAPLALQRMMIFPYLQGMDFFMTLEARRFSTEPDRTGPSTERGGAWRRKVFANPPLATTQILHPEKYGTGWRPQPIEDDPIADPQRAWSTVVGEFGIQVLLEPALTPPTPPRRGLFEMFDGPAPLPSEVVRAADGWHGDRLRIEDDADSRTRSVRWITRWETPRDAGEFAAALERALRVRLGEGVQWTPRADAAVEARGPRGELTITRPRPDEVRWEGRFPIR